MINIEESFLLNIFFLISDIPKLSKFWNFSGWLEKGNVVPVNKKNRKQVVNNYHPVSLLSICSKLSEKLIFDNMFAFSKERSF